MDKVAKSMNMISSTGLRPQSAAPVASPVMAASLMGVFRTRDGPCFCARPLVTPNAPPAATSSPKRCTAGSRANSSSSARRRISMKVCCIPAPLALNPGERRRAVDMVQHAGRIRPRRRPGALHRLQHLTLAALGDGIQLRRGDALPDEAAFQALDRTFFPNLRELLLGSILLRVADVMSRHAKGHALEQVRAGAAAQRVDCLTGGREHRRQIVAVDGFC